MPSALLRSFLNHAGRRAALSVGLLLAVTLLEAAGLLTLVPLIEQLGLGQVQMPGKLGAVWQHLFQLLGLVPSFELVLLAFVALLIGQAALKRKADQLNARIETSYVAQLREGLYAAMVQARWLTFTKLRAADLTRTLTTEVDQAGHAAQQGLALVGLATLAAVHLTMAVLLSPPLTALALTSGIGLALALRPLNRRAHSAGQTSQKLRGELNAAITEHLAGFKIAKSHGRGGHHLALFSRTTHALAAHAVEARQIFSASRAFFEVAGWLALLLFLYVAVRWARLDTAQLVLMVFVFTRLLPRIGAIQTTWQTILNHLPAFTAVEALRKQLVAAREELPDDASRLELKTAVAVAGVSFSYGAAPAHPAVRNVSFTVPARQMTALVGPSGAGKSTLADLLLGLLTPTEGRVLVDGEPLAGARLAAWRQSIGYVPQEPFLFHDTIRANLLWAKPDATEADLRAALRTAAAEAFVTRLPQGLDTIVGDRGVRLSGGERQRLTLARALLRRPTLLLLDEATSSLDSENERFVQQAIEQLHGELTLVVIAHRLSTVQQADQVIVLEQGCVVESGAPEELARREGGTFRRLMTAGQQTGAQA
ncbi:MAG: hypothetical protein RL514_2505 [Verrucomicrobiota bacterium]|jgi:ATP-binding cassette subfamily C protein